MEVNDGNRDWFGGLSDEILCSILSFLTLKDAVRTTTLSNRWRYLWVSQSNFNLNFDLTNVFGCENEGCEIDVTNPKQLDEERRKFVEAVDHFLEFYKGREINSFRVSFYLNVGFAPNIDRWINTALASGVKYLALLFSGDSYYRQYGQLQLLMQELYSFPYWLLSHDNNSISKLYLEACILSPPPDYTGFSQLRVLSLCHVLVGDALMQRLFSGCLLLEDLSLSHCSGVSYLYVVGASLRLVSLKLCRIYPLIEVQICAENLTYFKFTDYTGKISFIRAPLLAKVYCVPSNRRDPLALVQFARLPRLETLILGSYPPKEKLLHCTSSAFRNLRHLELAVVVSDDMVDHLWVCSILNALSLLQKLSLVIFGQEFCEDQKEIRELDGDSLNELKEVQLGGFMGNWYELELLKYLLKHAIKLERLVVNPFARFCMGAVGEGQKWVHREPYPCWYHSGRELALNFLHREVPSRVQVKIL